MAELDTEMMVAAASIDPGRLQVLLESLGWRLAGGRRNLYVRLVPPGELDQGRENVILPLDRSAPDFSDTLRSAVADLQRLVSADALSRRIIPRLTLQSMDEIQSRKETSAPVGLIRWLEGERFIAATRSVLAAGAKAFMEPRRAYASRYGRFATRYLDTIFMGQTDIGSYIVAAYAPADEAVALRGADLTKPGNQTAARDVTRSVGKALEATREALDHYRAHGSIAGFVEQVGSGVSRELLDAVRDLASDADESDVSISWGDSNSLLQDDQPSIIVSFQASDVPVLVRASNELAIEQEPRHVRVQGYVHFLSREEVGSPGTIGVDLIENDDVNKIRVRVPTNDQYHLAVSAHDAGRPIEARGNLQREGNLWWLYDATLSNFERPDADDQETRSASGGLFDDD